MASSFLPQRFASLLLAGTALVSCSSGGPLPPAEIDGHSRVGSISQTRRMEGRVGRNGSVLEGRVGDPSAYAADPAPENEALAMSSGTSNPDYLNTPNLATGDGSIATTQPFPDNATLPMIDSPEALGEVAVQEPQEPLQPSGQMAKRESDLPMIDSPEALGEIAAQSPSGPLVIPEEGISIDAELGVGDNAPVAASSQPASSSGTMTIAEGETDQPVVDGIGTDAPALLFPAKRRIP
ncbi:MAG: hypothetical protein ACOH2J_07475 [Allorhizobium sp.]